jgi:hypothetical protein
MSFEKRENRGRRHLDVGSGIGVVAAVIALGDEDEVEGRRGLFGEDGLDPEPLLPQAADEKIAEQVASRRENDTKTGFREAQPDEVARDVTGVAAEGRSDRAERELARPGHALEAAPDHIDDGDSADEDHALIVFIFFRTSKVSRRAEKITLTLRG